VAVSESVFVNYRVHDNQDSAVASLARKNLEALTHLGGIIEGKLFADWITQATSREVLNFLQNLVGYPPLYGDPRFSSEMTSVVTRRVANLRNEAEIQIFTRFVNALAHNVLVNGKQLKFLGLTKLVPGIGTNSFNFNLELSKSVCSEVRLLLEVSSIRTDSFPTVIVGCQHSESEFSQIRLKCDDFDDKESLIDTFLIGAGDYLEATEFFDTSVSPFEYRIVRRIRIIKGKIPRSLNKLVYSLLGR
jgi:hypothetical protein